MLQISLALQLYTVRDHLAKDYVRTLRKVKEIGYDFVELAGAPPFETPQTKAHLEDIGLSPAGIHIGLNELESRLDHWIEYCKTLGMENLVCPYLPADRRETREDWLAVAGLLDEMGARCRDQGIRLSYHNHSFEFVKFDGQYALDMLLQTASAENVCAEIDTYWIQHGGADPVDYVRKYAGRIPILHIKDMADDEKRSFAEIGNGILDWPAIHQAALEAGVQYYAVEQDVCPGDSLDSARMSCEFTTKLIGA